MMMYPYHQKSNEPNCSKVIDDAKLILAYLCRYYYDGGYNRKKYSSHIRIRIQGAPGISLVYTFPFVKRKREILVDPYRYVVIICHEFS